MTITTENRLSVEEATRAVATVRERLQSEQRAEERRRAQEERDDPAAKLDAELRAADAALVEAKKEEARKHLRQTIDGLSGITPKLDRSINKAAELAHAHKTATREVAMAAKAAGLGVSDRFQEDHYASARISDLLSKLWPREYLRRRSHHQDPSVAVGIDRELSSLRTRLHRDG